MEKFKNRNDLLNEDVLKLRLVEKLFLQRCRQFGYQEIKTASIEPLHIFTATDAMALEVLKKVYSFIDWSGWGGERVVLRPDCTISAARYYLANLAERKQARLCYMENHFRLSDTGQDLSERWQFGIEHIGEGSSITDVEVIFIAADTLKASGTDKFYLHLSFPAIIIECVNCAFPQYNHQKALDWIKKSEYDSLRTEGGAQGPYLEVLLRLLQFRGKNAAYLANLKTEFPDSDRIIQEHLERFYQICTHLDKLGYKYEINFSLSKDFEYYTGMQFEVHSTSQKRSRREVLCAGGRYDNLISMLGELDVKVPSVGFALYAKNLLPLINIQKNRAQRFGVVVRNMTGKNITTGQRLCNQMEELGFDCSISFLEIPQDKLSNYGLVLEVDHEKYEDGYAFLHCNQFGRALLKQLFKRGCVNE